MSLSFLYEAIEASWYYPRYLDNIENKCVTVLVYVWKYATSCKQFFNLIISFDYVEFKIHCNQL